MVLFICFFVFFISDVHIGMNIFTTYLEGNLSLLLVLCLILIKPLQLLFDECGISFLTLVRVNYLYHFRVKVCFLYTVQ